MYRPPWSPAHHEGPPPRGRPRLRATRRSHADAWLRGDARGRDGGVREELAAGVVLRSGGRSAVGGNPGKTFGRSELSAFDPTATRAGFKCRSAAVSCRTEVCYLSVRSTGGTDSETARVHHAARRGGNMATRGAGAAGGDASDRLSELTVTR